MIRVVFDTVVFVRSLINPHGRWGRLVFDHAEHYQLFLSPPLVQEILEVLNRPAIRRKYRTIVGREMEQLLEIFGQADVVEIAEIPPVSRDPKDDKVLATAQAAQVDYIVSEDQDLLTLEQHDGIRIIDAATFLQILDALDKGSQGG
jgi:putative PIN family toxin of toxin-antitoxin system